MTRLPLLFSMGLLMAASSLAPVGCQRSRQPPVRDTKDDPGPLGATQGKGSGAPDQPTRAPLPPPGRGGLESAIEADDPVDHEITGRTTGPRDQVDPGTLEPEADAGVAAQPKPARTTQASPGARAQPRPRAMTPPDMAFPPKPGTRPRPRAMTPPDMAFPPRARTPGSPAEMAAP